MDGSPLPTDLDALGAEYLRLRAVRGHFEGGDAWVAEVDSAGGRKQAVLDALGDRLGDGTHARADVLRVMGAPDRVVRRGDPDWFAETYERRSVTPPVDEVLVYEWRGGHDFLFFRVRGDLVIDAVWWYAGE